MVLSAAMKPAESTQLSLDKSFRRFFIFLWFFFDALVLAEVPHGEGSSRPLSSGTAQGIDRPLLGTLVALVGNRRNLGKVATQRLG